MDKSLTYYYNFSKIKSIKHHHYHHPPPTLLVLGDPNDNLRIVWGAF